MRLIDADAFIEDIKTEIVNLYLDGLKGTPRPTDELYDIIDRIGEQPTIEQPTWISVENRLPKRGEIVFCNTQNFFEVLQWDERADVWVGAYRSYWKEYVTHWMPLPEPPKGVE